MENRQMSKVSASLAVKNVDFVHLILHLGDR